MVVTQFKTITEIEASTDQYIRDHHKLAVFNRYRTKTYQNINLFRRSRKKRLYTRVYIFVCFALL